MLFWKLPPPAPDDTKPADPYAIPLILGFVGRTDLHADQRGRVEAMLRRLFAWLSAPADTRHQDLGHGLGLVRTPILLLLDDTLAAEGWVMAAIRGCAHPAGARVRRLPSSGNLAFSPGEYLAAYSDVLVAWTVAPDSTSTPAVALDPAAVIESKRRGADPRSLDGARALDWSDNGPVVHLDLAHSEVPSTDSSPETSADDLSLLYPYDCRPASHPGDPGHSRTWQARGRRSLQAVVDNLERFNAEPDEARAAERKAKFTDLLPLSPDDAVAAASIEPEAKEPTKESVLRGSLERIFRLRSRASALNRFYEARTVLLARRMFGLAFLAAVAVTFSDYWLPDALIPADPLAVPPHRTALFTASLVIIGMTWWLYRRFARTSGDARRNDYRVVAEGLRVQFYWTAAGTGASVASNYLQRQRGEVSWVRCAVSAASFPYERDRAAFDQLDAARQLGLLRAVREGWIHRQAAWFRDTVAVINAREALFSHLSFVLLWSGFGMNILFFAAQLDRLTQWRQPSPGLFVVVGTGLLGVQWLRSRHGNPVRGIWQRFFPVCAGDLANRLFVISALLALGVGGSYSLGAWNAQVPSALKLLAILKNLVVAVGVLCGAWSGVMFFGENRRRYAAIGALFQVADTRAGALLAALASAVEHQRPEEGRRAVADFQTLCVDLGKEALADNTDWLLMRRNHPLEPVMV